MAAAPCQCNTDGSRRRRTGRRRPERRRADFPGWDGASAGPRPFRPARSRRPHRGLLGKTGRHRRAWNTGNGRRHDLVGHHACGRSNSSPVYVSSTAKTLDDPLWSSSGPGPAVRASDGATSTFCEEDAATGEWSLHLDPPLETGSTIELDCWLPFDAVRDQRAPVGQRLPRGQGAARTADFPAWNQRASNVIPDRSVFDVRETGPADSIRCLIPIRSATNRLWNLGEHCPKNH